MFPQDLKNKRDAALKECLEAAESYRDLIRSESDNTIVSDQAIARAREKYLSAKAVAETLDVMWGK